MTKNPPPIEDLPTPAFKDFETIVYVPFDGMPPVGTQKIIGACRCLACHQPVTVRLDRSKKQWPFYRCDGLHPDAISNCGQYHVWYAMPAKKIDIAWKSTTEKDDGSIPEKTSSGSAGAAGDAGSLEHVDGQKAGAGDPAQSGGASQPATDDDDTNLPWLNT